MEIGHHESDSGDQPQCPCIQSSRSPQPQKMCALPYRPPRYLQHTAICGVGISHKKGDNDGPHPGTFGRAGRIERGQRLSYAFIGAQMRRAASSEHGLHRRGAVCFAE